MITAAAELPASARVRSLAELIFCSSGDDDQPIILGHVDVQPIRVSLRSLRHTILAIAAELDARGLVAGDTVCLVRLPRTSETLAAVLYAALSACGLRVLLPMYVEAEKFASWLAATDTRAVFWSRHEIDVLGDSDSDRAHLRRLSATVDELGIPHCCLFVDLGIASLLAEVHGASPGRDDPGVARCLAAASLDSECLVLTTSGTAGEVKLVRYRQAAFIASCASWEAAGLFEAELLGGRGLLLLFGHSMGIRAFWNALWTRTALCMISPEWFTDKPERVRALLVPMAPEHITGGPAAFRALFELGRVYPAIKEACLRQLRCAVSSGAGFDDALARHTEVALGLPLHNAYGTTETLQVLCTLVAGAGAGATGALGNPLPGVRLGLERCAAESSALRLYVASPFNHAGYVGQGDAPEWLPTGDLVELRDGDLFFVGREQHDFSKDGFGLKMPRERLAKNYANLGLPIDHLELYPLEQEPGLAALVYVGDEAVDRRLVNQVKALVDNRHERLYLELEDFEFRHLTIARLACVGGNPPRSTKGTPRRHDIAARHRTLIGILTGPYRKHPALAQLDRDKFARSSYERVVSPRQGALLRLARLDKDYVAGRGDRLLYRERGRDVEVVDFVGGFGGNLLGHRHAGVVGECKSFAAGDDVFALDQGSHRHQAGELARRLALQVSRRTGRGYVVRLASTGAEAVEMAIAHAMLEREAMRRRLERHLKREFGAAHPAQVRAAIAANRALLAAEPVKLLTIAGGFHGHSLAARSALAPTARKRVRLAALMGIESIALPADGRVDVDQVIAGEALALAALERRDGAVVATTVESSRIIAAIAEPILGEGGAVEVAPSLLRRLGRREFPLIIDEIQAGLGRAGSFLASMGIDADYYLFGKALGGGLAKISALLVDRARYRESFEEIYSSTFAADGFSCAIGARVLQIIDEEQVSSRARARGKAIYMALARVMKDYPDVIAAVRGRGLLVGLELAAPVLDKSALLRNLATRERYGVIVAAYLLNRHRLRLLPTLSAPMTLRIEPSVFIDDAAIGQLVAGLRALCAAVRAADLTELLGFMVAEEEGFADPMPLPVELPKFSVAIDEPAPEAARVAFITHFVAPETELAMIEPSLARLSATGRRAVFDRMMALFALKPFVGFARNLFAGKLWFVNINVPADAATFEYLHRSGRRLRETEQIQEAVDLAASLGCRAVGLGGYTSILSADGTSLLPPPGVTISSGNAFTVAAGVRRFRQTSAAAGVDWSTPDARLAVIGATGNIGAGIARMLVMGASCPAAVKLIGRDRGRLAELRATLGVDPSGTDVSIATEVAAVEDCNLIIIATNTNEPLLYPHHLASDRQVVVADLSVPSAVSPLVRRMANVTVTPFTGTVVVPGESDFVISSHTAPGTTFCCAAEAMLLGLEPAATAGLDLVGAVDGEAIAILDRLGIEHGFSERGGGGFRSEEVS